MIKLKHIAALFCAVGVVHAQTVTQTFNEPGIGDVDKNWRLDTSLYTSGLPLNIAGANVVWDFSKLSVTFPQIVDSFVSPLVVPASSLYPGSTFVQDREIVHSFFRSTQSPSQLELLGAWSPTLAITFTNTALVATYPIGYGYNNLDPVSGTFTYNTYKGAGNGSIQVLADGTGTLQFANGVQVASVLRVRSIENVTLSVGVFPAGSIQQNIYSYYAPGKKYPVLTVQYQKYQLIAGQPTITAQAYGSTDYFSISGIQERPEIRDASILFPNPFSGRLSAEVEYAGSEFSFFDVHGRMLLSLPFDEICRASQLGPGLYMVRVSSPSAVVWDRVLKLD